VPVVLLLGCEIAVSRIPGYIACMNPKLTAEQRRALHEHGSPVAVEDDETHKVYYLVDRETLDSLQGDSDMEAVLRGLADSEAGRTSPMQEVFDRIEADLRERHTGK